MEGSQVARQVHYGLSLAGKFGWNFLRMVENEVPQDFSDHK